MHLISSLVGVPKTCSCYASICHGAEEGNKTVEIESKRCHKKITLIISTSWSTPLSPGNRGYMDDCHQKKQKSYQREGG